MIINNRWINKKRSINLIRKSGLFNFEYYSKVTESFSSEEKAINHYLEQAYNCKKNPSIEFNCEKYLIENPDVESNKMDPLIHYLTHGKSEGRKRFKCESTGWCETTDLSFAAQVELLDESEFFNKEYYLEQNLDVRESGINPIVHYLISGKYEMRMTSEKFDTKFYLEKYPDVQVAIINPLVHYLVYGKGENRSTYDEKEYLFRKDVELLNNDDAFDSEYYLERNSDVAVSGMKAAVHYLQSGWSEQRTPSRIFDSEFYLNANPDIKSSGIIPLLHYIKYGRQEGRRCIDGVIDGFRLPFSFRETNIRRTFPVVSNSKFIQKKKIAIHLHCHYSDVADRLLKKINNLSIDFDLLISVTSEEEKLEIVKITRKLNITPKVIVVSDNRGRDISPMLIEFGGMLLQYDIACHVHTKKSIEKEVFGREWLRDIERKLFFNAAYVEGVIEHFEKNENCGIVSPEAFWKIVPYMNWGNNQEEANNLLNRIKVSVKLANDGALKFPAGSMFWFRPQALTQLLDYEWKYEDFPKEPIHDDGTIAHAIERSFNTIANYNGYVAVEARPHSYECSYPVFLKPKVSIIIPVYNAESWIVACLESVLAQDASHIPYEIICVDNDSTDNSRKLIEQYEILFGNIILVNETKKGAGDARNTGLRKARGEYIMFLDADDLLVSDALKNLWSAEHQSPDLIVSSLSVFTEDGHSMPMPYGNTKNIIQYVDSLRDSGNKNIWEKALFDFGPCAKLYKKTFLDAHGIKFPTGVNFEDNAFIYDVYLNVKLMAVVPKLTYLYRKYDGAETQSTKVDHSAFVDQVKIIEGILEKHLENFSEVEKLLILTSLITKLGWEFDRLNNINQIQEVLQGSNTLLGYVSKYSLWKLLGNKRIDITKLEERCK
jgi:glycosyltransferase involved in cell wall biosynthesis